MDSPSPAERSPSTQRFSPAFPKSLCDSVHKDRAARHRSFKASVPSHILALRITELTGERPSLALAGLRGAHVIIFDCNGVLVDSEALVAEVAAAEFVRAGIRMTPAIVARFFTGRRPADMIADVEKASGRSLPHDFGRRLAEATLHRLRAEVRATPHVEHALTWLRGPKCVASSSSRERIWVSLETTGLIRFFEPHLFSASDVANGKPSPELFLHAARRMRVPPADCIVVEDSPAGVSAAVAAGMTPIGFVSASAALDNHADQLKAAGARALIVDMRALKRTVVAIRGW
jgi:HAD superfamily hydrolase (TIGR01509 family)